MAMDGTIFTLAQTITGASDAEEDLLEMLCAAAEERVERSLRPGVARSDCTSAFSCTAAFLAAADLIQCRSSGESVTAMKAGSLSVTAKSSAEQVSGAAALRKAANRMIAPYGRSEEFSFCGVRG